MVSTLTECNFCIYSTDYLADAIRSDKMSKDERKYKFESKVKVPDIGEISKVAADFSDPVIPKSKKSISDSLTKNAKVAKLDSTITAMQKEMNKLAREVINEEKDASKDDKADVETSSEEIKADDKSANQNSSDKSNDVKTEEDKAQAKPKKTSSASKKKASDKVDKEKAD